jgi:hypothetical protein
MVIGSYAYKPIICINTGKRYESIAEAARELNLLRACISSVVNKKVKR